jgi:hypothetical protein
MKYFTNDSTAFLHSFSYLFSTFEATYFTTFYLFTSYLLRISAICDLSV